jgi:hypothetical protein
MHDNTALSDTCPSSDTSARNSAITWYIAAFGLATYGTLVLFDTPMPGISDLFTFLQEIDTSQVYIAAFVGMFFEGVYILGAFIPGTSLIMLAALTAGLGGVWVLAITTVAIYLGWFCAGCVNIFLATHVSRVPPRQDARTASLRTMILTCYPSFRATQEVAEIASGVPWQRVLLQSAYIKAVTLACFFVGALVVPYIVPLELITDREGVFTVYALAVVCVGIGLYHMRGVPVVHAMIRRVLPSSRTKRNDAEREQGKAE